MTPTPRINAILQEIPSNTRVLDIGCVQHDADRANHDDWLHQHLYEIAHEVLGIDILKEEVLKLREKGYSVEVGNAETFDLERRFDVIVAGDIIEHLSCPGAMLDRCREHLVEAGRLIVTTPNPWIFARIKDVSLGKHVPNPEHTCWFGPESLRELLRRHGFQPEHINLTRPPAWGVSDLLYRLGIERIGGSQFIVVARPESPESS